jgi:hypothetical protein
MAKYYKKSNEKKSTKQNPVCQCCLFELNDIGLKEDDFYWILKHDPEFPQMDHYFLSCINCINKESYTIAKPYKKKRGRPKKTDKK